MGELERAGHDEDLVPACHQRVRGGAWRARSPPAARAARRARGPPASCGAPWRGTRPRAPRRRERPGRPSSPNRGRCDASGCSARTRAGASRSSRRAREVDRVPEPEVPALLPWPDQLGHAPAVRDQARTTAGRGLQHDGRSILEPEAGDHQQVRRGEGSSDALTVQRAPISIPCSAPNAARRRTRGSCPPGPWTRSVLAPGPTPRGGSTRRAGGAPPSRARGSRGRGSPEVRLSPAVQRLARRRARFQWHPAVPSARRARGGRRARAPRRPGAEEGARRDDRLDVALHDRRPACARARAQPSKRGASSASTVGRVGGAARRARVAAGQQVHPGPASDLRRAPATARAPRG